MSTCKLNYICTCMYNWEMHFFSNVFKKRLHVNSILVICPAILEKHKVVQGHFWLKMAIDSKQDIQEYKILTLGNLHEDFFQAMDF